ncbi:MAG TPA: hypothetical protein VFI65_18040 [Streptosporangiaceae bacterium]|nr:hypothetical protein [Streptosporangiaceae bacterium]
MSVFALIAWVITVLAGLFLLAIWLIEYDPDVQRAAATRLPVPVISSHATLAVCGLIVWVTYLITGEDQFAYATLGILIGVVLLGITMAIRWVKVYRTTDAPQKRAAKAPAVPAPAGVGTSATINVFESRHQLDLASANGSSSGLRASSNLLVPPERHFPLAVVIGHGLFAVTTVVLVVLSVLGLGG